MTIQELLQLAPDAKTLEGARRLFFSRRWQVLAGDGKFLWGEFKVAGPKPLRAAVALENGSFYCSCRSRNRPCTHAMSLVMILSNQSDRITVSTPPEWVMEWAEKLQTTSPPVQPATTTASEKPASLEKRTALMEAGIAELELRLIDVMSRGLADTDAQDPAFWQDLAERLTDAKLSGLANRIRSLNTGPGNSPQQKLRLVGDLYLAVRAWQSRHQLANPAQIELLQLLGVNKKRDEVLAGKGREDHWLVMGKVAGQEDRLRYRRVWLRGEQQKQYGLLLDYAFGEKPFERSWPLASSWQGSLHFYPGSFTQRAIFPYPMPGGKPYDGLSGYSIFTKLVADYQRAIALNPWLMQFPAYLESVRLSGNNLQLQLYDTVGNRLPVAAQADQLYTLLAISGGHPISIFGEFDGEAIRPLSVFHQQMLIDL